MWTEQGGSSQCTVDRLSFMFFVPSVVCRVALSTSSVFIISVTRLCSTAVIVMTSPLLLLLSFVSSCEITKTRCWNSVARTLWPDCDQQPKLEMWRENHQIEVLFYPFWTALRYAFPSLKAAPCGAKVWRSHHNRSIWMPNFTDTAHSSRFVTVDALIFHDCLTVWKLPFAFSDTRFCYELDKFKFPGEVELQVLVLPVKTGARSWPRWRQRGIWCLNLC